MPIAGKPNVEVRRSQRRLSTVSAYRDGERVVVGPERAGPDGVVVVDVRPADRVLEVVVVDELLADERAERR